MVIPSAKRYKLIMNTKESCPTVKQISDMLSPIDLSNRIVTLEDSPHEVFDVLEAWNLDDDFYLGNVIKYVARAGKKNNSTKKQDLQKALIYLQRRIDSL
jgi:hypothetical protein